MAQFFHKTLRKSFNGSTINALLNRQNPLKSIIPLPVHHPEPNARCPLPTSSSEDVLSHFNRFQIYPSFSFGYFLNPISSSGFSDSEPVKDRGLDGSSSSNGTIWADSVKKKRKKKMNKHKLKKLKKRLRHCS